MPRCALFRTTFFTGIFSILRVCSSWMFIKKLPSPSILITCLLGKATCAPMAAGKPNPIAPSPDEQSHLNGSLKSQNCAAHIWCWPTPTETIASSSASLFNSAIKCWGTISFLCRSYVRGNSFFHLPTCLIQGPIFFLGSILSFIIFSACLTSPCMGISISIFLFISDASISTCINLAPLQNSANLPVTRSSKRTPSAIIRSAWFMAIFA